MDHHDVTTISVGAQQSCANPGHSLIGIGTIAQQPHFAPVTRRVLMAAVNTAGRELGLRAASVVVLDALLSCLPCNDAKTGAEAPITPLMLLTVFACNDTLCFRAKGITDRQLRRHLDKLEAAGLIQRRDSANGKRFPIMRQGKVVGAFGIDLSPLLARSAEIIALAQQHRDTTDELRGLKSYILKLRADCLCIALRDEALRFVEATRNLIRRASMSVLEAKSIIAKLDDILQSARPIEAEAIPALAVANINEDTETNEMTDSDGQNVRHKETQKSYTKKMPPVSIGGLWTSLTTIPLFYPDEPRSEHALLQMLFEFGKMLRIDGALLAKAVSVLGIAEVMQVTDQIATKVNHVQSPDSYLARILQACGRRQVGHGQLRVAT